MAGVQMMMDAIGIVACVLCGMLTTALLSLVLL
jgi:hypothetical protein